MSFFFLNCIKENKYAIWNKFLDSAKTAKIIFDNFITPIIFQCISTAFIKKFIPVACC